MRPPNPTGSPRSSESGTSRASESVLLTTGLVHEPKPRITKIIGAQLDMAGELIPIVGRPADLVATDELPVVATAAQIGVPPPNPYR